MANHMFSGAFRLTLGLMAGLYSLPAWALSGQVAVYQDTGVFEDSTIAAEAAWRAVGLETSRITAAEIQAGGLVGFDALTVPGGWAVDYVNSLGPEGAAAIQTFVANGGGYFGICAGGYLASSRLRWYGRLTDYPLDLINATAIGPLNSIAPWPEYAMTGVDYQPHALTQGLTDPAQVLYYGGAYWRLPVGSSLTVLARYTAPEVAGQAAMLTGTYGKGRVFVTGPHPEIEEGSPIDGVTGWDDTLIDPESDWPLMHQIMAWLLDG